MSLGCILFHVKVFTNCLKATLKKCILEIFAPAKVGLSQAIKVLHSINKWMLVMRNNKGTWDFTYPLFKVRLGEIAEIVI